MFFSEERTLIMIINHNELLIKRIRKDYPNEHIKALCDIQKEFRLKLMRLEK